MKIKPILCALASSALLLSLAACDLVGQEDGPSSLHTEDAAPPVSDSAADPAASPDDLILTPLPASSEDLTVPAQDPGGPAEAETENPSSEEPDPLQVSAPVPAGVAAFELSGSALLAETEDYGQEYVDRMIFLGDSTTYGMKYYAVLSDGKNTKQVWTPSNGTLTLSYQGFASIMYPEDDSEIGIRDAVERSKPEYLVITLGVNGVSFMEEDYFKSEYTDLVTDLQAISPDTRIILQSIFPVASNYEYLSSINNDKIAAANGWILDVAEETGVRFLNTASVLIGADGWLPQSYQNGDGLHLNETGFNVVLAYIRTHGYQ